MLIGIFYSASANGISEAEINELAANLDFSAIPIKQNLLIFLMLMPFVFGLAALWLSVTAIHRRPFKTLITPVSRLNWQKIFFAFALWFVMSAITELIFYAIEPANYHLQFQPEKFFVLMLISLIILPLQTSFEELMFRGYLLQGISLIAPFRWIPLLLTSVAFGLLHIWNPEVAAFGTEITMAYYIGTGLFLGFLTLMDDSLELALGIHAATNIYSALFVTFDDSALQTAALFRTESIEMTWMLPAFLVGAAIFTYVVAKKYGWQDWSKWHGKIERPGLPIAAKSPFGAPEILDAENEGV
ncbi:MAG: type II CAAX endopeptidase family protein [Bacteroidota bacterium]